MASRADPHSLNLFVCGDVMTGRGIDQVLPHPNAPTLYEEYVTDARGYVRLAEQAHGEIARPVAPGYIWGDALAELDRRAPDLRIVNLETAVTSSDDAAPGKGINYRMHPANIACLTAARVDCAVLANNHVLDWGEQGLIETLATLRSVGISTAGAGADSQQAAAPAVLPIGGVRVLVFAYASASSGVPQRWRAGPNRPGVQLLPDTGVDTVRRIAAQMGKARTPGDWVIVSLHWGANWGYPISRAERDFAHALIDHAGADLVHGHSSHHARALEVWRERLILYGCGDFINDYEGIGGHEDYRGDLALAYFVRYEDQRLRGLDIVPFTSRRFRLQRATPADTDWLCATLNRESRTFGTELIAVNGGLRLRWHTDATAPRRAPAATDRKESLMSTHSELQSTIEAMVRKGKGILAADESAPTIAKRFKAVGVESTEENRRTWRSLLLSTPGIGEFLSGVILFEETLGQRADDGTLLPQLAARQGIVPGIKVDAGKVPLAGAPGDEITQGLDGLAQRLEGYKPLGARFAKWRAVYNVSDRLPSRLAITTNAEALARYAAICQQMGLVPIVEPEVLIDGDHTMARCAVVTEAVLHEVFHALHRHGVVLELIVLKPSMVLPGKEHATRATPAEVAAETLRIFRRTVPAAVPSINFLSGGQSPEEATANLDAMNRLGPQPWNLSFSYSRALQDPAMKTWKGQAANARATQDALLKRARMNGAAQLGKYSAAMEAAG